MKLKYIMTEYGPVIFPTMLIHSEVAEGLGNIDSAGFVYVDYNKEEQRFDCKPFGESISVGVASKDIDKAKLDKIFNEEDSF